MQELVAMVTVIGCWSVLCGSVYCDYSSSLFTKSSRVVSLSALDREMQRIAWSMVVGSSPNFRIRVCLKRSHSQIK